MDSELGAMQSIAKTLEDLDADAQRRVIAWLTSRFLGTGPAHTHGLQTYREQTHSVEEKPKFGEFTDFAELFHAVNPVDNSGKALVASYWLSIQSEGGAFPSQSANALLKDIGYQVSNITDALSQCMREKPSLVIQVRKSGSSKQARKLYKITDAGRRKIQSLLSDTP